MKTINTLAIAALSVTVAAYLLTMGTSSAPAETGGDRTIVDELPPKHQAAPLAQEKPHAEPPVLVAKPGPNPMTEALRSGDVCAVQKLKKDSYALTKDDAAALLETISPSPELSEILAADGPLLGAKVKKSKYPSVKLLWILRQGALCDRCVGPPMEDLPAARQALLELEKSEPGNAAYPYFRLAVEHKQHQSAAVLTKTAEAIAAASFFDTHFTDADTELARARTLSPSHFILYRSIEYYVQMRPNLYAGIAALSPENSHQSDATRHAIGRMLMEKAEHSDSDMFSGEYNPEEYEAGRTLMQDSTLPQIYEISEQRSTAQGRAPYPLAPALFKTVEGQQECDSREFEEFFYANSGKHFY